MNDPLGIGEQGLIPMMSSAVSGDASDALDRMDALLDPERGLLTVGANSATAIGSRSDMRLIRAALASQASPAKRGAEPSADDIHYAIDKALLAARRDQRDKTPETMATASDLRTKAINAARALAQSAPSEKLAGAEAAALLMKLRTYIEHYDAKPSLEYIRLTRDEAEDVCAALASHAQTVPQVSAGQMWGETLLEPLTEDEVFRFMQSVSGSPRNSVTARILSRYWKTHPASMQAEAPQATKGAEDPITIFPNPVDIIAAMTPQALARTSPENIADVLLAIAAARKSQGEQERTPEQLARDLQTNQEIDAMVEKMKQPNDECLALDFLAILFDEYENGPHCYEDPDGGGGFLGNAVKLDAETFQACADLLNRRRPVVAALTTTTERK